MARRLNTRQAEQTRAAIQATVLVKRLVAHVNGDIELSGSQVNAALGLLSYALPKPVQQTEQVGEVVIRWKS